MIPEEILIWFLMINDGIIFLKFEIFYDFSFVMLGLWLRAMIRIWILVPTDEWISEI